MRPRDCGSAHSTASERRPEGRIQLAMDYSTGTGRPRLVRLARLRGRSDEAPAPHLFERQKYGIPEVRSRPRLTPRSGLFRSPSALTWLAPPGSVRCQARLKIEGGIHMRAVTDMVNRHRWPPTSRMTSRTMAAVRSQLNRLACSSPFRLMTSLIPGSPRTASMASTIPCTS